MIPLRQFILEAYPGYSVSSFPDISVNGLECDSRKVQKGFVFIAVKGKKLDGDAFIQEAVSKGAVAIVSEDTTPAKDFSLPWILVRDSRDAVLRLSQVFYANPSKDLKIVGVTGTNGKTTTTYLLEHLLLKKGLRPGVIGTVNYRYAGKEIPAAETTPGPLQLQRIFSEMKQAHCSHALMEVSSHALDQNRTGGVHFSAAIFTNLTRDHLDYHVTMENYFEAKSKLFSGLSEETSAIINHDDEWGMKLASKTLAKKWTFGLKDGADFQAVNLRYAHDGAGFELKFEGKKIAVHLPLIGAHNVYNALGAIAAFYSLGFSVGEACAFLSDFKGVPGRLESVRAGQDFAVVVDFAHTPDGLENVLRSLKNHPNGKLILVFGCGGDRDRAKRPQMASIAAKYADRIFVTSDNPRSEDPKAIAAEICGGFPQDFKKYAVVIDRRKAIRQALLEARTGDMVLLAGKGHERSQIIGNESIPFSDREEVERVLVGR